MMMMHTYDPPYAQLPSASSSALKPHSARAHRTTNCGRLSHSVKLAGCAALYARSAAALHPSTLRASSSGALHARASGCREAGRLPGARAICGSAASLGADRNGRVPAGAAAVAPARNAMYIRSCALPHSRSTARVRSCVVFSGHSGACTKLVYLRCCGRGHW